MKNRKTLCYGIAAILCLGLCACFSPLDYKGSQGTISLTLPGEGSAARAAVSPPNWHYELKFSGPDGTAIPKTAKAGETVSLRVEPGVWSVSVIALRPFFSTDTNQTEYYEVADGSDTINVKPGIKNLVEIPMAITDPNYVKEYLNAQKDGDSAANPVRLPLNTILYDDFAWGNICSQIGVSKKFVDLDLTRCQEVIGGALDAGVFDPRKIGSIYSDAPDGMAYIVRLTLPDEATSIADATGTITFADFSNLQHVNTGKKVTIIGMQAFSNLTRLTSVTFGEYVDEIGTSAFAGCKLTSVTIPASVTSIGDFAFDSNPLTTVIFMGDEVTFNLPGSVFPGGISPNTLGELYSGSHGGAGTYTRPPGGNYWTKQ